jgi:transcriptional regulator with XRE-family HTH domain
MRAHEYQLKDAAQKLGVAKSCVSQWANGQRFPKPEQLDALAQCANVATGCLFCPTLAELWERQAAARQADANRQRCLPPAQRPDFTAREK